MPENNDLSRRRVLEAVGAGVGTTGMASAASAQGRDRNGYVVGLEPGADLSVATGPAIDVANTLEFSRDIGRAVVGDFDEESLETLRRHPDVRYVEANGQMYMHEAAGERVEPQSEEVPYGIDVTNAIDAIEDDVRGENVTVAVVDTGVDPSHEDLEANVVGGYATDEATCGDCDKPWGDDQGHGTHVSGTVAAAYNNSLGVVGVAPEVNILGVKVLGGDGSGSFAGVAEGIEWAANNGAQVINLSLGSSTSSNVVADAIEYAANIGVTPVSSAGNSGPCSDCVGYPAAQPEAIAVSSTDSSDNLSFFSSTGPEVDIAAPGSNVKSTYPDDEYESLSGTSMSAPHVTGAAAAVLSVGTDPELVRTALQDTADDVGLGPNEQGAGRLNVAAATDDEYEPSIVEVITGSAGEIDEKSATFTGYIEHLEAIGDANVWFEYGPVGSGMPESIDAGTAGDGEPFVAEASGLESGTSYEFVAVASVNDGTATTEDGYPAAFDTEDEGGFCFITTATANETETLDSLRRFRDESMKATPLGRGMVGLYYRISPPIARTLERHPDSTETALTRKLVDTCAALSDSQDETDSRIKSAAIGVLLTVLYIVGILVGIAGHASLRTRETLGQ